MKLKEPTNKRGVKLDFAAIRKAMAQWHKEDAKREKKLWEEMNEAPKKGG